MRDKPHIFLGAPPSRCNTRIERDRKAHRFFLHRCKQDKLGTCEDVPLIHYSRHIELAFSWFPFIYFVNDPPEPVLAIPPEEILRILRRSHTPSDVFPCSFRWLQEPSRLPLHFV